MRRRRWAGLVVGLGLLAAAGPLPAAAQLTGPDPRAEACPAAAVPRSPFTDRAPSSATAVDCLYWYGFTTGVTATEYRPTALTTRAQLASFVVRVLGSLDGVQLPAPRAGAFPDVVGPPHAVAIETLAALDPPVLRGYADGGFRPDRHVTRAELASVLVRLDDRLAATVPGYTPLPAGGPSFPDVPGGAHRAAVERLAAAGVLLGFDDGTFGPDLPANRGHVALVLRRWLDRLVDAGLLAPPGAPQPDANVGAARRSVLPLSGGTRDYLAAGLPGPQDATSVGVFVERWDDGRIDVGNGEPDAHWVRDDLVASAVALQDRTSGEVTVLVSADLYMIFNADVRVIRQRVLEQLPAHLAGQTSVAVMTTHNHHGPDTAWNANHAWYEHMMDQVAGAAVDAVRALRPATLSTAAGEHWFGMGDTRDAQVIDPTLNVLQATSLTGEVIATVVQWNNHPEVTLGWDPPDDRSADCAVLGQSACSVEDRYFTADYPGHLRRTITEAVGGEVVYVVGALGGLVAPLRVPLWEVDGEDGVGLGDQYTPPPGAVPAGGSGFATFTEANFRRAAVIGEQAGHAVLRLLESAEQLVGPVPIRYRSTEVYTRLSNIGFRALMVVGPDGHPSLGHTPPQLFTCPVAGPKTAQTCAGDDLGVEQDPQAGTIRRGDHGRTEVAYLQVGPVGMVFLPGEVVGELVHGLPAGFDDESARWFEASLDLHADGEDYRTPGYVRAQMPDRYRWVIGMGNDELGYVVPISDWRIGCVLDAATCRGLHEAGVLAYPDSASGEQCKAVTEDPSLLAGYGPAGPALAATCRYGQALGEAESHYEETMAAGWDVAQDLLDAVRALTGGTSTARINPDFPGYWRGLPPPARQPIGGGRP